MLRGSQDMILTDVASFGTAVMRVVGVTLSRLRGGWDGMRNRNSEFPPTRRSSSKVVWEKWYF
jgi:hypothetical protein